jgi:hypothetical protein
MEARTAESLTARIPSSAARWEEMMETLYQRCCGRDIHKRTVVACLITPGPDGQPQKAVRTFGTMSDDLLQLGDWLAAAGCTHVAMESTGVYWQPIYNLLEGQFDLSLVNAQHIKATSVHYPHWEHERIDGHGHGHGSGPSAVWAELIAAGDHP